jgi:hypothetical protein
MVNYVCKDRRMSIARTNNFSWLASIVNYNTANYALKDHPIVEVRKCISTAGENKLLPKS